MTKNPNKLEVAAQDDRLMIRFTKEEIPVVLMLLDRAVRGSGLEVAENAVVLAKRFQEAE